MDGFRVGAAKHLLEAAHLRDEPQVDPDKAPVSGLLSPPPGPPVSCFPPSSSQDQGPADFSAVNIVTWTNVMVLRCKLTCQSPRFNGAAIKKDAAVAAAASSSPEPDGV